MIDKFIKSIFPLKFLLFYILWIDLIKETRNTIRSKYGDMIYYPLMTIYFIFSPFVFMGLLISTQVALFILSLYDKEYDEKNDYTGGDNVATCHIDGSEFPKNISGVTLVEEEK